MATQQLMVWACCWINMVKTSSYLFKYHEVPMPSTSQRLWTCLNLNPATVTHQNKTFIEYYQHLAKISCHKFNKSNLYISPATMIDDSDKDHLRLLRQHANSKINVGVMYKTSPLYRHLNQLIDYTL